MAVKGTSVAFLAIGGIFVWSGLFNKKITQTIQDLVKGTKPVPGPGGVTPVAPAGTAANPVIPTAGINQGNRALGRTMAAAYGWTGEQWSALDWVWTTESNWENHASNPSSGAYGIPQALPGSKMGALANPPLSSAVAQIRWGLSYIKQRYGNPVNAKAFHLQHGWY